MALQYEKVVEKVVASAPETAVIDFPSRTEIAKIIITQAAAGAFNATVYNKQLTRDAINVQSIVEDPAISGKTLVIFTAPTAILGGPPQVEVGEELVVAASGVGGYDTTHTVVAVYANGTVSTDQTYTADATSGGTATPTVAAAEHPLYEVMPLTAAVGGVVRDFTKRPFFNQDHEHQLGNRRKIYVLLSANGTYKISIAACSHIH